MEYNNEENNDSVKTPYQLDELIEKLEAIRDNKIIEINLPKALYTLALEIQHLLVYLNLKIVFPKPSNGEQSSS